MSLYELAANERRTVQCNFSFNYNLTNYITQRRENRLGREGEVKEIKSKLLSRSNISAQITKNVLP